MVLPRALETFIYFFAVYCLLVSYGHVEGRCLCGLIWLLQSRPCLFEEGTESSLPEAHCKGKEEIYAWRVGDSSSAGCGSTAERGRFALLSCLTPQAGVSSTEAAYPPLFVFG